MPGHYGNKKKKRAPSARPTKSKGPVMKAVKNAAQAAGVTGPLAHPMAKAAKKATGQLKLNMKKMPPEVQKKLMDAMKKKKKSSKGPDLKYNPYGTGTGSRMNPTRASRTTGP